VTIPPLLATMVHLSGVAEHAEFGFPKMKKSPSVPALSSVDKRTYLSWTRVRITDNTLPTAGRITSR